MSFPKYPEYKATGLEWPTQAPAHWKQKRLKFAVQLNPSRSEVLARDRSEEVSFLPMEAVGEDGSLSLEETRPIAAVETGYTYFRDGDVTIAKITPCFENGKGAVMSGLRGGIGFGTTELIVARPRQGEVVPKYLHSVFTSASFRGFGEASMYGAGGQKRVSDDFVRNFRAPMPPLSEQAQIQNFLDRETAKIDALVAEQERLIELLEEKRQAVISHAVTKGLDPTVPMKESDVDWLGLVPAHWKVKAIKWLSPVLRGASPRPIDDPKFFDEEGEYAWVRIADASASDGVLLATTQQLSTLGASLSVKLQPGTLFVSIAGTVGKPCIAGIKCCIHDGFVYFPRLRMDPMFLYRLFESGLCYAGLGKMGTQLNLNTDTIGSIKIGVPPPEELAEILRYVAGEIERFRKLVFEARSAINLLLERRSSLISAAVTGQIDVRQLEAA